MPYGYDDDAYAAKVMLQSYRPMDVGAPDNYGIGLEWLGPALSAASDVTSVGIGVAGAGKQSQLELAMQREQTEALAQQGDIALQIEAEKTKRFKTAALYTAVVAVVLGGSWIGYRWWMER